MSLLAASLTWFGNSFHSLGADARKDLSPYMAVWLLKLLPSKVNRTQIGAFSLVYIFRSDHSYYSGAVPFSTLYKILFHIFSEVNRTENQ